MFPSKKFVSYITPLLNPPAKFSVFRRVKAKPYVEKISLKQAAAERKAARSAAQAAAEAKRPARAAKKSAAKKPAAKKSSKK